MTPQQELIAKANEILTLVTNTTYTTNAYKSLPVALQSMINTLSNPVLQESIT